MSMDAATAERWVTISAAGVAGLYAYRRLTEPTSQPATLPKIAGIGQLPQLGAWATAWGFTFFVVAIIAEASPALGGSFAVVILVADLLTNATSLLGDIGKQEQPKTLPAAPATSSSSTTATTPATAPATGAVTASDLTALAKQHGWGASEIAAWLGVIAKEDATGSLTAQNPTSPAYGIAQFIEGPSEYATYGGDATTKIGQLTAMANYIAGRYGTPSAALAHENAQGNY